MTRYTCDLASKPRDLNFVQRRYVFKVPKSGRVASVDDAFGRQHTGGKIAAAMTRRTREATRVDWKFSDLKSHTQLSSQTILVNVPIKARL